MTDPLGNQEADRLILHRIRFADFSQEFSAPLVQLGLDQRVAFEIGVAIGIGIESLAMYWIAAWQTSRWMYWPRNVY